MFSARSTSADRLLQVTLSNRISIWPRPFSSILTPEKYSLTMLAIQQYRILAFF